MFRNPTIRQAAKFPSSTLADAATRALPSIRTGPLNVKACSFPLVPQTSSTFGATASKRAGLSGIGLMAVVVLSRPHLARGTIACGAATIRPGEGQPYHDEPQNEDEGKADGGHTSVVAQGLPALTTVFIFVAASTWARIVAARIGGHGQDGVRESEGQRTMDESTPEDTSFCMPLIQAGAEEREDSD